MAVPFAYVKASKAPFMRGYYAGTSKSNQKIGDTVYVISADSPRNPRYYLEGKYEISGMEDQKGASVK